MKQYRKAVTFSYDDGVESDRALIELFDRYGLKASFNLNSGFFAGCEPWTYRDFEVRHPAAIDPRLYKGHEVCLHGALHRHPLELTEREWEQEYRQDKRAIEELFQTAVVGGAYPYGEYDARLEDYLRSVGVSYCRTVKSSFDFTPSADMLAYEPTCRHRDENVFELIDRFLSLEEGDTPQIFYLWGHSYELPAWEHWERMEEICRRLSGHDDILYGTNTEVFRYFDLI